MNPNIRAHEIFAAFQRYLASNNSTEIDALSLNELRSADEQLGQNDVGSGPRIAIQNKIKDLELKETRAHESKIRAWNLVTGIIVGLVGANLGAWLFSINN